MADVLWLAVTIPLFTGAALSFLIEHLLQPRVQPFWRRPPAAIALHIGLWLLLFAFELALFQRPWFAVANVLALQLLIVLVSNAKYHSLREPFICQDFEYFTDALKHPRLYLPFFGLGKALLAAIGYGTALFAGLTFEPSLTKKMATAEFFILLMALVIWGLILLWLGVRKKLPVLFKPEKDLQQLGLVTSLWRYSEEERGLYNRPLLSDFVEPAQEIPATLPDLVVVQSESFFDIRDLFAEIRPEVLQNFDSLKTSAAFQGKLSVPAWGANTVRTEFAFLSGLSADKLGVHRFNPYRKLAQQGVPTLATFLQNLGYRTVCVHPYPASFYNRAKVFPILGFDEFIDIRSFKNLEKTGPYIGDVSLAESVCAMLGESSSQPIFVFVITMENHGPLHWEMVQQGDVERFYSTPPPNSCEELTIYLRHLCNSDRMMGMLRDQMNALPNPGWLCWFGDHVPIMPSVYQAIGLPGGKTDYFIWGKGNLSQTGIRLDVEAENLGSLLLTKMGLVNPPTEKNIR